MHATHAVSLNNLTLQGFYIIVCHSKTIVLLFLQERWPSFVMHNTRQLYCWRNRYSFTTLLRVNYNPGHALGHYHMVFVSPPSSHPKALVFLGGGRGGGWGSWKIKQWVHNLKEYEEVTVSQVAQTLLISTVELHVVFLGSQYEKIC